MAVPTHCVANCLCFQRSQRLQQLMFFSSVAQAVRKTKFCLIIPRMSQILRNTRWQLAAVRLYSSKSSSKSGSANQEATKTIPKNLIEAEGHLTAVTQPENGHIYDKKPFKVHLEGNKLYSWCLCGKSKSQPVCDGTHKNQFLKIKLKPIQFKVEKSGDYWLCNCKQTKHRPFCDGTHKQPHIQAAVK